MSQIGQVIVNYNTPSDQVQTTTIPNRALIVGLSQRGPVYLPVPILDIESFLIAFGQPTNEYEFNFFQTAKSVVESGGVAVCYRIPYADVNKKLYDTPFEYYITDLSKLAKKPVLIILEDQKHKGKYYRFYAKENNGVLSLFISETENIHARQYVLLQNSSNENEFYRLYIYDKRVYVKPETNEVAEFEKCVRVSLRSDPDNLNYKIYLKNKQNGSIGLFLTEYDGSDGTAPVNAEYKNVYDVVYKKFDDDTFNFDSLPGAKLTFTLLNDFNSAFVFDEQNAKLSKLRDDCFNLKTDIDPSQIFGIFPILFGPQDAKYLRNIEPNKLCYLDGDVVGSMYMDRFEVYTFRNNSKPFQIDNIEKEIINKFEQFERTPHFKKNWLELEVAQLIDTYIPQDISDCKNTVGIAFVALYLTDDHKLDYKILESFYGLIGTANDSFDNIENLVNNNSCFFHLDITGDVPKEYCVRAFNRKAFIYSINERPQKWLAPLVSPYTPENEHIVNTMDIFSYTPINKYSETLSKPLSKLYDMFIHTDFYNTVPYNYVTAPGLSDVLLLVEDENINVQLPQDKSIVSYWYDTIDLDSDSIEYIDIKAKSNQNQTSNVRSLYRMLAMFTGLGDKGSVAFIDIPKPYNDFLKDNIALCYNNENKIKDLLAFIAQPQTSYLVNDYDVLPKLNGTREIYDRTYPLFNYQYVDKDKRLTRYHKFKKFRRFELVPGSAEVVRAYASADFLDDFGPLAGVRSTKYFYNCHKSYVDNDIKLFKLLFDLYGVSSLMNDRDNGTYAIQQTTWNNTTSILKQLHAFRIYIDIRRNAYDIVKAYIYELNTTSNINNMHSALSSLLNKFKDKEYIDDASYVSVWSDIPDIDQHQVHVEIVLGIYGAIVKIIINMNLTSMKIEIV